MGYTPPPSDLKTCYRYWREHRLDRPMPAHLALQAARQDVAQGQRRYPRTAGTWNQAWQLNDLMWPEWKHGPWLRWVDRPYDADPRNFPLLRKYKYADEICRNSIRHTGWYCSEEDITGEQARGCVFRLPARKGRQVFLAGFEDPCNGGACGVVVEPNVIWDDEVAAAYRADKLAETYAERERQDDSAWRAGQRVADLRKEIRETRASVLKVLMDSRDLRRSGKVSDAVMAFMRRGVAGSCDTIADARKKIAELTNQWSKVDNFHEGIACGP